MFVTARQQAILRSFVEYQEKYGMAPTMDELAGAIGVTKAAIYGDLRQLELKGLLERDRYQARGIRLVEGAEDLKRLPFWSGKIEHLEKENRVLRDRVRDLERELEAALGEK